MRLEKENVFASIFDTNNVLLGQEYHERLFRCF